MQIKFGTEFIIYTSGLTSIKAAGKTVSEALSDTFTRFPQLHLFLTDNKAAEAEKTSLKLNGEFIFEEVSLWLPVGADDVLEFGREVPEGESAGARIIAGVILIAAAVTMAWTGVGTPMAWNAFSTGMAMLGGSLALGGLTEILTGQPKITTPDGFGSANDVYAFSGIRNSTAPGTPVPIIYGEHRTAGHLTAAYVEVKGETSSYLMAQIGVSEGEIESITSIEVDKRPFESFVNKHALWRNGTAIQDMTQKNPVLWADNSGTAALNSIPSPYATLPHLVPNSTATSQVVATFNIPSGGFATWRNYKASLQLQKEDGTLLVAPPALTGYFYEPNTTGFDTTFTCTFNIPSIHVSYAGKLKITGTCLWQSDYRSTPDTPIALKLVSYTLSNNTDLSTQDGKPDMLGFGLTQNTVSYNSTIGVEATTQAQVATQIEATKVYIGVTAPALYWGSSTIASSAHSVSFKVKYREHGAVQGSEYYTWRNAINTSVSATETVWKITGLAPMKSELCGYAEVNFPPGVLKRWDIMVYRDTAASTSIYISDDINLTSITEESPGGQIYPHTALLGIKLLASAQLDGSMPTITSVVKGIKVALPENYNGSTRAWAGPWTGSLTTTQELKQWTDSPVWCLYDLITNTRYGLGNYFKITPDKVATMLGNFKQMADYCDERVADNGTVGAADSRCRFSLNIIIDESRSAIEWLNLICTTMRASLYYTEGCVYIDIDRPKDMTQIFTMSSIKEFSQSRTSYSGVPNTYELQYTDATKRYEPQLLMVEDPIMQTGTNIEQRSKTLQLRGVTNEQQARSIAKYALYAGKYCRTNVSFKTGTQGLRSMVGDVVGIQHDVPEWGISGKITGYSGGGITLNTPFTFEYTQEADIASRTPYQYSICLQKPGKAPVYYGIDEPALTGSELTAAQTNGYTISWLPLSVNADGAALFDALTEAPEAGDTYVIGFTTNVVKPFRIINLKRDSDEFVEVTAVEYVESLYTAADNISDTGGVSSPIYQQPDEPVQVSVTNPVAAVSFVPSPTGVQTVVTISYTKPTSSHWAGVEAWFGTDDYSVKSLPSSDGAIVLTDLPYGNYIVALPSFYKDGTRQTRQASLATAATYFTIEVPANSAAFLRGVDGLSTLPFTLDGTFVGKDCSITWKKPVVLAAAVNSTAGGSAGTNNADMWFRNYQVIVTPISYESWDTETKEEPIEGVCKRTFTQVSEGFTYTHEMNHLDGAVSRHLKFTVIASDILGRTSGWRSIICSNPAPAPVE